MLFDIETRVADDQTRSGHAAARQATLPDRPASGAPGVGRVTTLHPYPQTFIAKLKHFIPIQTICSIYDNLSCIIVPRFARNAAAAARRCPVSGFRARLAETRRN
ncbi:MAG TPA: hypothetical protein VGC74_03065, partial [Stenotrophomonas sp.]